MNTKAASITKYIITRNASDPTKSNYFDTELHFILFLDIDGVRNTGEVNDLLNNTEQS